MPGGKQVDTGRRRRDQTFEIGGVQTIDILKRISNREAALQRLEARLKEQEDFRRLAEAEGGREGKNRVIITDRQIAATKESIAEIKAEILDLQGLLSGEKSGSNKPLGNQVELRPVFEAIKPVGINDYRALLADISAELLRLVSRDLDQRRGSFREAAE